MAASIQASVTGLALVDQARRKKGWTKKAAAWCDAAGHLSTSTLDRFWARKPISQEYFVAICKVVGVDWEMIADLAPTALPNITRTQFSAYNPQTFTGREAEIVHLTTLLRGSCRVLAITGMTGIGKTALAERVVANLMESSESADLPYIRFSLDDRSLSPDFAVSGAGLLRTLGDEPTLADQQDAANLLAHILQRLCSRPCRLQIDSLERLLKGNEQQGWSEFRDPLWLDLLNQFLAGNDCPNQLVLTSQDIPGELDTVASRYPQFWHCQTLNGLNAEEQWELFRKLGVLTDPEPTATELDYLREIGAFYDGHPLVLQVIADEMLQPPFQRNITRYWHHYEAEFTDTAAPTTNKLARSRLFRWRVRQRVEQMLQRLTNPTRQMLCACSVFRRPVPEAFWLAMLPEEVPEVAFDTLQDCHLLESVADANNRFLVRQHNLIRSVAYDLLKADISTWHQTERQAAELWLTVYNPLPDTPNLETVRGYLEAFEHYCQAGDWDTSKTILLDQGIGLKLQTWGNYKEALTFCRRLLGHLQPSDEVACQKGISNAYYFLSNYSQAINYWQQSLNLAQKAGDRFGEWAVLSNLGPVYVSLHQYEKAINALEQSVKIAKEIGNRNSEARSLGNLGLVYNGLKQYEQAIDFHQQCLKIMQEVGDRQGECSVLGDLGLPYSSLGQYERAIDFHQRSREVSIELGNRLSELRSMSNLGFNHNQLGQYERAIGCYQQALEIAREVGNRHEEGIAQSGLGTSYRSLGQYERAIDPFQQYLTITREIELRYEEGLAQSNLGNTYHRLGQYERAINFHEQHLTIAREIGDREGEGGALVNLGGTQLKLKQYSESLANNQLALEIFREIGDRTDESEALKNLVELHKDLGDIEAAQQYCQ